MLKKWLPEELFKKYEKFVNAKKLEGDPLVRFCPKPGCTTHFRAENKNQIKLKCPKCATEVCFKCRDLWHGDLVTCEEAMNKQLEGWME